MTEVKFQPAKQLILDPYKSLGDFRSSMTQEDLNTYLDSNKDYIKGELIGRNGFLVHIKGYPRFLFDLYEKDTIAGLGCHYKIEMSSVPTYDGVPLIGLPLDFFYFYFSHYDFAIQYKNGSFYSPMMGVYICDCDPAASIYFEKHPLHLITLNIYRIIVGLIKFNILMN